jgi:hypothetical protein
VFWPWGLSLVAAKFEKDPEGELFGAIWDAACQETGTEPATLAPLREAIVSRLRREWLPGFALVMSDPAEPIESALSEAEQVECRQRAQQWLMARLEAIRAHKGDEW